MSYPIKSVDSENLLTVSELAHLFKVPEKTVYYWVSRTKIPHIKVGKHLRFIAAKVLNFFEELSSKDSLTESCRSEIDPLKSSLIDCSLKTGREATQTLRKG